MNQTTFDTFRQIVHETSGIALGENKVALVSARVGRRMRALGLQAYDSYLDVLQRDQSGEELIRLLDAISINVTSFFREEAHFAFLREAVTNWQQQGQRRFRLWSCACSTGEEPYSMAMTLLDALGDDADDVRILATDISTQALGNALSGTYDRKAIRTVPPRLVARCFQKCQVNGSHTYAPRQELRDLVLFRRLNLAHPPFPMRGQLDVVFCRNVMIYFDNDTRRSLVNEITRLLRPGGCLVVGSAESLAGVAGGLRNVAPSTYVKM